MKLRSTFDNIVERHEETLVGVLHNLLVGFNSTEFYNVWRKAFSDTSKKGFCILYSILNLVLRKLLFQRDFFLCDGRKDLFKRQNVDL